jgi:large subunit ribosomal protein L13
MNLLNNTFLPTKDYKNRNWFIIDCKGQKLGRVATLIAALLKGKGKPNYCSSVDMGDYVILINAESILVNEENKHYIVSNPGRPGHSLKIKNVSESLPKFTIEHAVKGMLGKSETKRLMRRLKIYNHQNHLHQAQNPIEINVFNFYGTSELDLKLTKSKSN